MSFDIDLAGFSSGLKVDIVDGKLIKEGDIIILKVVVYSNGRLINHLIRQKKMKDDTCYIYP